MFADLEKLPDREKLEKDNHKRFKIFFWILIILAAIIYIRCLFICKDNSIVVGGILFGVTITIILINVYRKSFTEYNNTLKIIRNKKVNIQLDLFKSASYLYLSGQLENTEKFEKYFYNRATADSLRAVCCCIFTGMAQKVNSICCAYFLRK